MNRRMATLWGVVACLASCGRSFDRPPPVPVIEELKPTRGFMGDRVIVTGAHFEAEAENNLVFFGAQSARVLAGGETSLIVEVPELTPGEEVYVKVSTSMGQVTSEDTFFYLGPGHPLGEKLDHVFPIEWAPLAVTSRTLDQDAGNQPMVLLANATGRTLSLLDTDSGWHFDFGVRTAPISLATVQLGEVTKAYLTTVELDPEDTPILQTRLETVAITEQNGMAAPSFSPGPIGDLPEVNGSAFRPTRVWSYCKQAEPGLCLESGVVVSDMFRPVLLLLNPANDEPGSILEIGEGSCPKPERSRPVADLLYDPVRNRLLAVLDDGPEIWALPEEGSDCPVRIWPTTQPESGSTEWNYRLSALAFHWTTNMPSPLFYAAENQTHTLLEFEENDPESPEGLLALRRSGPLGSPAFALTTARTKDGAARTVAATEQGILVFDLNEPEDPPLPSNLPVVASDPLPSCRGTPQSLGRIRRTAADAIARSDEVVFADAVRDIVHLYPVASEGFGGRDIPLGVTAPQLATSRFSDTLYLADPFTNIIRLIDRTSGMQSDQFAIFDEGAFGTPEVTCLDAEGADLLLVPLPSNSVFPSGAKVSYNRIIVRRAGEERDIRGWVDQGYTHGIHDTIFAWEAGPETFHQMIPAVGTRTLYLVRYGNAIQPGRVWSLKLAFDSVNIGDIIQEDPQTGLPDGSLALDADVLLVRLGHDDDTLVLLRRPKQAPPYLTVIPIQNPQAATQVEPDATLSYLIADMALGPSPLVGSATLYLSLPPLGQVAVIQDGGLTLVETTGTPHHLFLSPDARRLYVTHQGEGKLSIIDTDCRDAPGCERMLANLPIDPYPGEVLFHPSGREAFVSHWFNNVISVVE